VTKQFARQLRSSHLYLTYTKLKDGLKGVVGFWEIIMADGIRSSKALD